METITITAKSNDNSSNKDDDDDNNNKAVKGSFIRAIKSQYFKKLYM
jgi:hypothetical protein